MRPVWLRRHIQRRPYACSFLVLNQAGPFVVDPIVLIVTAKFTVERLPYFCDRLRQVVTQPILQIAELATQLLARRLPLQLESTGTAVAAVMR